MAKKIFFIIVFVEIFNFQSVYAQKLQFGSTQTHKYDEVPFFLRGIYQLDDINIVPNLTKEDSALLSQSNNCLSLVQYFDKSIPNSILTIDIATDSIKFLNTFCTPGNFHGFFERKFVKSFSTTHNPEKLGYIDINLNLIDKNGVFVPAVIKIPQLTLEFGERFMNFSSVYSISGRFKMIKYRHPSDNSLIPILRRTNNLM